MQRLLRFIGVAFIGVIVSMLWFWLLFGGPRFLCAGSGLSLFIVGAGQFAALALVWGLALATLATFNLPATTRLLLWSFVAGAFFFVLHQSLHTWRAGIDYSLSALAVIVITQSLVLGYLRALRLHHRQFRRAILGAGAMLLAGILGVLVTTIWRWTIPCAANASPQPIVTQIIFSPIGWYIIGGALPAGITAILYASEIQMPADRR